jgi:hypothetical protein
VIEFEIDEQGQWQKKDGPFVMGDWNKQRLVERRKRLKQDEDYYQQQEDRYKLQVHKSAYAGDATEKEVDQLIGVFDFYRRRSKWFSVLLVALIFRPS